MVVTSRQRIAFLLSVGLQSMAERELTVPDAVAIAAIVDAGKELENNEDVAEAIRQLTEQPQ